jgi:thiamine biosynthesis protein ThiI
MSDQWLIKIGEISLKKGNRAYFERILKENIKQKLVLNNPGEEKDAGKLTIRSGRFYLDTDLPEEDVIQVLQSTPGIVGFSRTIKTDKDPESIAEAAITAAKDCINSGSGTKFKFEVRRTDKSLPLDSYGYARELGGMLLDAIPELSVDVHKPDFTIKVELREKAYVYQKQYKGPGGLPTGTAGRGMLLLSGGIDSPAAGYLMAKRGLKLYAVHFHTPPFTSPEALEKVIRLAALIAPWSHGITLYTVSFTECQIAVNQSVKPSATTLHTRAAMMRIAQILAKKKNCGALVTGESLGQVASQTLESLAFTDSAVPMTVFRPLIGMDKEEIVSIARKIDTFETAIEPYDDCCTVFSPEHPLTRPDLKEEKAAHSGIEGLDELIAKAAEEAETIKFDALGGRIR